MDPVAALIEIAELLERERASRYRARAFRQAAAAFAALPEDVRSDPTRLRAAKGIGASKFEVIRQAPFLSEQQKRDILYDNAARFLRLDQATIERHQGL